MYVMYSSKVTFRAIKLGRYVTPGDGGNYVTFHELNVRIKIKKDWNKLILKRGYKI